MKSVLVDLLTFQLKAVNIKHHLEHKVCKSMRWRIDIVLDDYPVAIECEGGQWVNGRHNRPQGFAKDMVKYNEITISGLRLLRFNKEMISSGKALTTIERLIKTLQD